VLIGAAAHFECRNEYRHYGGDHIIFIGHVERYAYTL
jgi:flavin reductase (DIM6/NTAB) family NADH-FMN oxidoreductase RutF